MAARQIVLTLFHTERCGLCDNAKEALLRVQKTVPFTLKELNLNKPECPRELAERYVFDTPVVHMNNKFLLQHRVDEQRLKQALEEFRQTGKAPKPFV
ncbi:thioredoxin-like protein [Umbelopsis sp. PMI_123]|nr:thioredoxin-like protein [Umbelopsis sp. PMI_123]